MATELELQNIRRMSNTEANRVTKRCIQSATVKLMGEMPFQEITPTDIIARSGVSRASFYRNYRTKEEVILDYCDGIREKIAGHLRDGLYHEDRPAWYGKLFQEVCADKENFRLILEAGLKLTDFFPYTDVSDASTTGGGIKRYARLARQSAFCRILEEWFRAGMRETPETMGDFCERFLHPFGREDAAT